MTESKLLYPQYMPQPTEEPAYDEANIGCTITGVISSANWNSESTSVHTSERLSSLLRSVFHLGEMQFRLAEC